VTENAEQPLRVVKGNPTDDELAALVAVISAKAAAPPGADAEPPSNWAAYWRRVRTPLRPGRGAWRASALPR